MREGKDVTLVAFGKLVGYNLKAAEELEKEGISCEVVSSLSHHMSYLKFCGAPNFQKDAVLVCFWEPACQFNRKLQA